MNNEQGERLKAIIFDTETTGLDEPQVIEACWMPIDIAGQQTGLAEASRWKPSKPIQYGAMAAHHIMEEDLDGCPPSSQFRLPDGVEYLIGHNVDFDWRVAGEPPIKRIDVCALCRSLWPECDSHSQSAMLYRLERATARERLREAHSAVADAMNCRLILLHVLGRLKPVDFAALWTASELARVPTHMPFGKHKGVPIRDVPADYRRWLLWLLGQADVDPYLVQALRGAARAA